MTRIEFTRQTTPLKTPRLNPRRQDARLLSGCGARNRADHDHWRHLPGVQGFDRIQVPPSP